MITYRSKQLHKSGFLRGFTQTYTRVSVLLRARQYAVAHWTYDLHEISPRGTDLKHRLIYATAPSPLPPPAGPPWEDTLDQSQRCLMRHRQWSGMQAHGQLVLNLPRKAANSNLSKTLKGVKTAATIHLN